MLLFTKKIYQDMIDSGKKTIEIRTGVRYRNIKPGHTLNFNHRFKKEVVGVVQIEDAKKFIKILAPHYKEIGMESRKNFKEVFKEFYGGVKGPYFAFILGK